MDIDKLARKLEPLMPRQVQHWLKVRDIAEPDLKALIEKQIISVAYQKLGDFRKKILLSLPPKNKAKGSIHLGTVLYESEKWPAGILRSELMQNMAIFGRSGAGKTNVAFHILEQLIDKKIPFLFLDWKRTGRHLIPKLKSRINIYTPGRPLSQFPFNPFIVPPGIEDNVYINQVVDIMADAYTLGDGSRSILQKAIKECYGNGKPWPTVVEVLKEVEKMPEKGRTHGWKISAVRALESLAFSDITAKGRVSQEELVRKLLHENTIIELDALAQGSKKFLIPLLCLWLYYVKLGSTEREKLSLVIFVEEAHHVLHRKQHKSKESVLEMLLRQCREIGIGIVVIDQHPHLISSAVLGNAYASLCLNLKDPSDINKAAAFSLIHEEDKKYFSMLPVGQGIVKLQNRWRRPFLVEFPLVNIKKGLVTDEVLKQYVRSCGTGSRRKRFVDREFKQVSQVQIDDKVLDEDEFVFLQDVIQHEDDGVKIRYKRIGVSVGTGNRLKEELLERGWIEDEVVKVGKSRKVLLRLTKEGKEALGLDGKKAERASLVHEYWKRWYAGKFKKRGYRVYFEVPRRSGKVDVLARKGAENIAIEVETGKSDVVWNVRQDLLSGFEKVLVVATDKKALEKVERELGREGLIIEGRVEILLRDNSYGVGKLDG